MLPSEVKRNVKQPKLLLDIILSGILLLSYTPINGAVVLSPSYILRKSKAASTLNVVKSKFISAKQAYHGSTQGAMSLKSDPYFTQKYRPLLPGVSHHEYNSDSLIEAIDDNTAGVVLEVIQAEAGVIKAEKPWLEAVQNKCKQTGTQLIFDEIQTGFGRTGKLFAFEYYGVAPDILCIAKGMGGGMPIGAFISSREKMYTLAENPILGHITTFGGHPVSCSAALATLEILQKESAWILNAEKTATYIASKIQKHPIVKNIRHSGLLLCVDLDPKYDVRELFEISLKEGIITDGFLFNPHGYRIAPPLCIDLEQVEVVIEKVLGVFDQVV